MRLSAGPSIAYRRVGKLRKVSDLSDLSDLSDKRSHYAPATPPSSGKNVHILTRDSGQLHCLPKGKLFTGTRKRDGFTPSRAATPPSIGLHQRNAEAEVVAANIRIPAAPVR